MDKFKYVILLISVLIFNACTQQISQQNKRTQDVRVTEVNSEISATTEDNISADDDAVNKSEVSSEIAPVQTKLEEKEEPVKVLVEVKPKEVDQEIPETIVKAEGKPKEVDKIVTIKEPQVVEKKEIRLENISGKISLNTDAVDDKDVDIKSTVVYFKPNDYVGGLLKNENYLIASQNKRFVPSVLAVQKGSTVTFPNMDRILHNVFSVSNVQQFDLGLYSAGKEKTVTFDNAGIIYVHCNVHHSMQADILVLDTPFYTYVNENGHFSLKDLPSKSGELYFWHPRAKLHKIAINNSSSDTNFNQTIEVVRKKVPLHKNKFGQSYRPTRDEK